MAVFILFFFSIYMYLKFFEKKLIPLLSLEILMILVILSYFMNYANLSFQNSLSFSLIFLVFMVLDSVLGIVLLISSSRFSNKICLILL